MNIEGAIRNSMNEGGELYSFDEIRTKYINLSERLEVRVQKKALEELEGWKLCRDGNIRHNSGKFFSIVGIQATSNLDPVASWSQPIINQPEIGYLGFLVKNINNKLHFLTQFKVEPGNKNKIQLSPTLQATRSNYNQVHKGNVPKYLEDFVSFPNKILNDQLCSEQGARFYRKRNRNIIKYSDTVNEERHHTWLTLFQLKKFMEIDDYVNMDTRTVLSMLRWYDLNNMIIQEVQQLIGWIVSARFKLEYSVELKPINDLKDWKYKNGSLQHSNDRHFRVIGADILIEGREVQRWNQPLIQPTIHGLIVLAIRRVNQSIEAFVSLKHECGLIDGLELSPTLSCRIDSPILKSYIGEQILDCLNDDEQQHLKVMDVFQSEEGGRFFEDSNRNVILWMDNLTSDDENNRWVSLESIIELINIGGYVNIQLRNLISMINPNKL